MSEDLKRSPLLLKYREIFNKDPTSKVFAPLAEIYRNIGLPDKAIEVLSIGLRANPNYLLGILTLASCYIDREKYLHAYELLCKSLEQNKDNIKLLRMHALSCTKLEKFDEALKSHKMLLFLNPKDPEAIQEVKRLEAMLSDKTPTVIADKMTDDYASWVQVNLHQTELDLKDLKEATKTDTKIEVTSSESLEDLSKEWLEVDSFKPGEEQREEIVIEAPQAFHEIAEESSPFMTHTLVDLYCNQGHFDQAMEILEKIIELSPDDERSVARLNEIRKIVEESVQFESAVVDQNTGELIDEGRSNLMVAVNNIAEMVDDIENSSQEIESRLNKFLFLIQKHSEEVRAKYA